MQLIACTYMLKIIKNNEILDSTENLILQLASLITVKGHFIFYGSHSSVIFFLIIPQIFQSQAELNCLLTYTTSVANNISPVNINHKKKRKKRVQCLLWDSVPNHTLSDHKKIPLRISGLIGKYMSNQDFWVGLYQSSNRVSRENILKECTMTRRAWSNQPFLML